MFIIHHFYLYPNLKDLEENLYFSLRAFICDLLFFFVISFKNDFQYFSYIYYLFDLKYKNNTLILINFE